jgi:hypothetical protein
MGAVCPNGVSKEIVKRRTPPVLLGSLSVMLGDAHVLSVGTGRVAQEGGAR